MGLIHGVKSQVLCSLVAQRPSKPLARVQIPAPASRNFVSEVRDMDKQLIDKQLKSVFVSENKDDALQRLKEFKSECIESYPRQTYSLEKKVNYLFTYFQYPHAIRRSIHSNKIIERMNKEVRR